MKTPSTYKYILARTLGSPSLSKPKESASKYKDKMILRSKDDSDITASLENIEDFDEIAKVPLTNFNVSISKKFFNTMTSDSCNVSKVFAAK